MKCERKGRHFSWSFILDASRYFLVILISLLYSSLILAETCEQHEKCRQEFKLDNNFLTYYTTHKINLSQTQIKRLVIVVHGALRNGHEYFDDTVAAAKKLNVLTNTMVLAPTFRKVTDERKAAELYWGRKWYAKWKYGYLSEDSTHISSFEVIDKLIRKISKSKNFPNLKTIVITGHSAGGQFTQRYGVASKISEEINQQVIIVPSNPSSYMYLDEARYHFTEGNFTISNNPQNCPDFNDYIYGPNNRAKYMESMDVEELRENFKNQKMIYLMSEQDKGLDSLDRSCEAMTQGKNRFERAKNFYYYVKKYITSSQHRFLSIANIGHDHVKVYQSKEAAEILFGIKPILRKTFLYKKIGNVKNVLRSSDYQFVMFGGGKNEIQGMRKFLKAAHGGNLLVISGKSDLNHRYTHEFWNMSEQEKIPLQSVETIAFLNKNAGENKFIQQKIRNAEAIFFTGGDQSKYINRIKNTWAHKELLNKVHSGVSIAGTSAGLAIMSEYIFSAQKGGLSSRYVLKNPLTEEITLEHDFFYSPLLRNLITDTHFSKRKREGRLLGFMFKCQLKFQLKNLFGVGIDEQTSLVLTTDFKMHAFGLGSVRFYRAPRTLPSSRFGPLDYGDIDYLRLTNGKEYDHYSRLVMTEFLNVDQGRISRR
jgi:cyanophycinase